MTHYIVEGGAYDLAWRDLRRRGFRLSWTDAAFEAESARPRCCR
jgi:hypothetical protein